jgi:3-deoxy-manno-octulosonate cytidylyltransferase (CMP-KDO synthetase)
VKTEAQRVRVVGVIPARMAATRLPGKPLVDICGKPMIQRVWEKARQARNLADVLIATPDNEIVQAAQAFGGRAIMTSDRHRTGTDRLAEAASCLDAEIVVNIQGDEPLIDPGAIDAAADPLLTEPSLQMTSLMVRCPKDQLDNPATVKVVCAASGTALYFSRARVPFHRASVGGVPVMQHVGLYAYRRSFLVAYAAMPPSPLELTEMLEQLRALENGVAIRMVEIARAPLSVDTPEDLDRVRSLVAIEERGSDQAYQDPS